MGCGSSSKVSGTNEKVPTQQRPIHEVYKFDPSQSKALGEGSFAYVVKGWHIETNEVVAIKIINQQEMKNQNTVIQDEINVLAEVSDHPNIIKLHAVFVDKINFYLVMELCEGGDLFSKIVSKGSFSEKDAAMYCRQLAQALKFMHDHGVAHRDLKPENLLLDAEGNLKVADFGLSKIMEEKHSAMKTVCGTWAYAAPEVIKRKGYDHLVDVWSLGVLQFVMLAGYHPFDVYGDLREPVLLKNILEIKFNYDDPVWATISSDAKMLIKALLKKSPKDRMSLEEYLEHPWVTGITKLSDQSNLNVLIKLTAFVMAHRAAKKLQITKKQQKQQRLSRSGKRLQIE